MLIKTLSYVFVMLIPLSCGVKNETKKDDNKMNSNFDETTSEVVIGKNELVLSCLLWTNLMPTPGEKKVPPLLGSIKLLDKNGKMLPKALQLKKLYFIQGDKICESNFSETKQEKDTEIEGIIGNNELNLNLDNTFTLICEFFCEGKSYQIAAREQKLGKVH